MDLIVPPPLDSKSSCKKWTPVHTHPLSGQVASGQPILPYPDDHWRSTSKTGPEQGAMYWNKNYIPVQYSGATPAVPGKIPGSRTCLQGF